MALSYYTHSKKDVSPLWLRYREGSLDLNARTLLSIQTDRLKAGKIIKYRITPSDNQEQKVIKRKGNQSLNLIQNEMDALRRDVLDALNSRDRNILINSKWLKGVVQPNTNQDLLNNQIEAFLEFKKISIKPNTIAVYMRFKKVIREYQKHLGREVSILEIDLKFKNDFQIYLTNQGYANNTIILYVRSMVSILHYAEEMGSKISSQVKLFKKGLRKKKTLNVYLSFNDIDKLISLKGLSQNHEIARDWLVISCETAQRVADLFQFDAKNISKDGDWLTVQQSKNETSAKLNIPLMPNVKSILNKYNGEFPPLLNSKSSNTNYHRYNTAIKEVCKLAELDELTNTLVNKTDAGNSRIESKQKWELVSSHIGRRSFATNYYGKLPTALIQSITGHLTESSFLLYIDRARVIDKDSLMNQMLNIRK